MESCKKTKQELPLRVNLDKEDTKRFNELKEYFGIKASSDMVRFLIKNKYNEVFQIEANQNV